MTEPDFSPPQDGADAAISAGRRRRTHRQLGGAGAAAGLALVAVLVAAHPFSTAGGSDSLRVAGDPPASAGATPDPAAGDPTTGPTSEPSASATPDSSSVGGGPQPVSGGGNGYGDPSATPDATGSPDTPDRVSAKPTRSVVAFSAGSDCTTSPLPVSQPPAWCLRYAGDDTVARGGSARIAFDLCRPAAVGDGSVTFSDEDGLSMDISNGSTTEWTSQDGRSVKRTQETVTVKGGTCLRWTTTWDTRDRDGFRVRPGDYSVGYSLQADASISGGDYGTLTVTP